MQPATRIHWEDAYHTVIPHINADGLLIWSFDSSLPIQVRFHMDDPRRDHRLLGNTVSGWNWRGARSRRRHHFTKKQ